MASAERAAQIIFVGVGKPPAAKVRHRVGLAPHDVVEDPEAEVLQDRADAKDVVVGADDDERRVALHQSTRGAEPAARKSIVFGKVGEFVPVVVDGVDKTLVRARQRILELQIVRRVGENEVDRKQGGALRAPLRNRRPGWRLQAEHLAWRAAGSQRSQYAKPEAGTGDPTARHGKNASKHPLTLVPETTPRRTRYGLIKVKAKLA